MKPLRTVAMLFDAKLRKKTEHVCLDTIQESIQDLEERSIAGSYHGWHYADGKLTLKTRMSRELQARAIQREYGRLKLRDGIATAQHEVYSSGLAETHFIDFEVLGPTGLTWECGTWRYDVPTPREGMFPEKTKND